MYVCVYNCQMLCYLLLDHADPAFQNSPSPSVKFTLELAVSFFCDQRELFLFNRSGWLLAILEAHLSSLSHQRANRKHTCIPSADWEPTTMAPRGRGRADAFHRRRWRRRCAINEPASVIGARGTDGWRDLAVVAVPLARTTCVAHQALDNRSEASAPSRERRTRM